MEGVGIRDKSLLLIDRALTPKQGDVIIAVIQNELTCKIYDKKNNRLLAANKDYPPIHFADYVYSDLTCEGVVINSINSYLK